MATRRTAHVCSQQNNENDREINFLSLNIYLYVDTIDCI